MTWILTNISMNEKIEVYELNFFIWNINQKLIFVSTIKEKIGINYLLHLYLCYTACLNV